MPDESSMLANGEDSRDEAENTEGTQGPGKGKPLANGNATESMTDKASSRVLEYLQEAREEGDGEANASAFHWFRMGDKEGADEDLDLPHNANGKASPATSLSTPDDTPSIQVGKCLWMVIPTEN
jgi:hypothetical protein